MDAIFLGLRVLVSLGAVLAIIWWAHRRITRGKKATSTAKPITVISRQGITQKASVVIVEADGRRLLLGVTEHSVNVLSDSPAPAIQPAAVPIIAPPAATFEQELANAGATADSLAEVPSSIPTQPPASQGLLSGSVLSAETWKRSWAVLRQGPER